ncbi:hypothetical protein [Halomarina oriensis]|uniref:Uncharacterized protein n=1 Tax=Halomarina oriensis TaxID=671145 RepID=A0A6B0GKU8_9EURY|nr:hypothetical protein [Halomarina oriensis]MWG34511.1 hypothetical protein [Halomarina oriensis]
MHRGESSRVRGRPERTDDTTRDDETSTTDDRYGVVCRACPFARTVDGLDPALDWTDRHTAERDEDHSVDVYAFGYLADLAAELPPPEATEPERRAMALVTTADSTSDDPTSDDPTADGSTASDTDDERTAGDD